MYGKSFDENSLLIVRSDRFGTFKTNLLTIPSTVLGFCSMFLITLLSEAVNDRAIVSMLEDLWALPFLVALYCLPEHPNPWIYYVSPESATLYIIR